MPERMKPYRIAMALMLLIAYLGVQALTGDRGLLTGAARDARLVARESQLADLEAQRADLETRVEYLQADNLSRDLLEERARAVLGFANPHDYVIRVVTPVEHDMKTGRS
ncbi:septum formation initiator [Brevundimonas sp. Leaf363]|uniref:FtsB family cell division protein n=1 Tax=Brevundimonas sp. Leaf363 TaxID=1736353 RepID=UPI0006FBE41B|nr:septum formation initiator family protein [Brevundimonas sp. Leaf363]KQS56399.1 septum formation initiator [Brevundimonas sp. Leaf363]